MATRKYRVKPGFTYGATGQYKAGDIVELEDAEAQHVMDKLELAEVVHNVPQNLEPAQQTADSTDSRAVKPGTEDEQPVKPEETKSTSLRKKSGGD
jgi:hypothetical protein